MTTLNYPTGSDNVERRDSDPHAYSSQFDPGPSAYEESVNAACATIRHTPLHLVTPAFIDTVLRTLACKAMEAQLPELSEALEVFADEVEP